MIRIEVYSEKVDGIYTMCVKDQNYDLVFERGFKTYNKTLALAKSMEKMFLELGYSKETVDLFVY